MQIIQSLIRTDTFIHIHTAQAHNRTHSSSRLSTLQVQNRLECTYMWGKVVSKKSHRLSQRREAETLISLNPFHFLALISLSHLNSSPISLNSHFINLRWQAHGETSRQCFSVSLSSLSWWFCFCRDSRAERFYPKIANAFQTKPSFSFPVLIDSLYF